MRLFFYLTPLLAFAWFAKPAQLLQPPASEPLTMPIISEQALLVGYQWLLAGGALLTGGALSWGVSHYVRQQRWQRIEFLRKAVKEFEQDPDIYNALKILDFEEYRDYAIPASQSAIAHQSPWPAEKMTFRVDDELLCNALANHDQRSRFKDQLDYHQANNSLSNESFRQYQIETALRDWFNKMLNGLEHFGYFLESGLFTQKELQPWLNYWIKLIADPAYRRPGASKFYDALYSYIHHSGFFGVQKLFERFGYRILPSPYKDTDLVAIQNIAPGYSTHLALTLAKAAYLAYQDKQFVAEIVGRWVAALTGHTENNAIRHNFRYFNNRGRDTQAYMFRTDEYMVLAFRGSQEPQDWMTNFTTQLRSFTIQKEGVSSLSSYKGRVHTGFFLAWAIIEKSVLGQIQRWRQDLAAVGKPLPPLYITGHSLGGALATIATAGLADNGVDVAGVYTFGQPRVGDRTFTRQLAKSADGKVFRFVNNNDIVPHIPPPFSLWNPTRFYGHVGTATYFDSKGILIENASYKLGARLKDIVLGTLTSALGGELDSIADHRMEYYISHLENTLNEEIEAGASRMLQAGKI